MKELPDRLQGWITPNGRYVESKKMLGYTLYHAELAESICKKKGYELKFDTEYGMEQSAEDRLYELGFMKIQHNEILMMIGYNQNISDGQVQLFHRILDKFGKVEIWSDNICYSKQDITRVLQRSGAKRVKHIDINGRLE